MKTGLTELAELEMEPAGRVLINSVRSVNSVYFSRLHSSQKSSGRTICAFGEACAWPTQSFVTKFREEFASKASKPLPPPMPPEYNPDELIEKETIEVLHDARTGSPLAPAALK